MNFINLSAIGYSSSQGVLVAKNFMTAPHKNIKYSLISFGVNDLDFIRFFGNSFASDAVYLKTPTTSFLEKLAQFSHFFNLSSLVLRDSFLLFDCSRLTDLQPRVSTEEFKTNILKIINISRNIGTTPVLINTMLSAKAKGEKTLEYLNPHLNVIKELAAKGRCSESISSLSKYREQDALYLRQKIENINLELSQISRDHQIPLVDAFNILNQTEDFIDPIHPSRAGHQKLSLALAKALQ